MECEWSLWTPNNLIRWDNILVGVVASDLRRRLRPRGGMTGARWEQPPARLYKNLFNHTRGLDSGKFLIEALERKREFVVVQAEQV